MRCLISTCNTDLENFHTRIAILHVIYANNNEYRDMKKNKVIREQNALIVLALSSLSTLDVGTTWWSPRHLPFAHIVGKLESWKELPSTALGRTITECDFPRHGTSRAMQGPGRPPDT